MSNKKFSFYAVRIGRQPGIYRSWEECSKQVTNYNGAIYKGFFNLVDAENFLQAIQSVASQSNLKSDATKQVVIYTDGASIGNPGPGGYAAVLIYGKHRKEVKGGYRLTTNNRMEIMAVLVGLGMLRKKCSVTLHTDSQYVINAFVKGWIFKWQGNGWKTIDGKPVANKDLWQQLIEQYKKHQVNFQWIRGHTGNPENERCDELSKSMAKSKTLPRDAGFEKQFSDHSQKYSEIEL